MNLYELIQRIPDFITRYCSTPPADIQNLMLGKFHLGALYDMSIWQASQHSPVYPCQFYEE
jgi:hypothetical protein